MEEDHDILYENVHKSNLNNSRISLVSVDRYYSHIYYKPDTINVNNDTNEDGTKKIYSDILRNSKTLNLLTEGYNTYRNVEYEKDNNHVISAYICKLPKSKMYIL